MENADKLWFKSKRYGWGWVPSSWQGWVVTAAYVVVIEVAAFGLLWRHVTVPRVLGVVAVLVVASGALLVVCYKRGEPPRWRWGPGT